jgi:hypothetical protein
MGGVLERDAPPGKPMSRMSRMSLNVPVGFVADVSPEMYRSAAACFGHEKGRPDRSSRPFEAPTKEAYASSSPSIS